MTALNFTDADLEANRAGWMSEHQVELLRLRYPQVNTSIRAIVIRQCLINNWFLFILVADVYHNGSGREGNYLLIFAISLLCLFFFYSVYTAIYTILKRRQVLTDIQEQQINIQGGTARIESTKGWLRKPHLNLFVGDVRWKHNDLICHAFQNGGRYAVYYAPHSKTILSAEWLSEA